MPYTQSQLASLCGQVANQGTAQYQGVKLTPPNYALGDYRLIVQVCKTPAGGSWVDISDKIHSIDWLDGDISGAVSRAPIQQMIVVTKDLSTVLGDFVDPTNAGAQTGMLIRWMISPAGGFGRRMYTMIIESIDEIIQARVRAWRLSAFGTLIYFAGLNNVRLIGNLGPGTAPTTVGETLQSLADQIQADSWGAFAAVTRQPWPFAGDALLPVNNDPLNPANGMPFECDVNLSGRPPTDAQHNALGLLHQLADSAGQSVLNLNNGGIAFRPWGWNLILGAVLNFSDEPTATVPGHPPIAGTITARPKWLRSQSSTAADIWIDPPGGFAGDTVTAVVDAGNESRWATRSDVRGFPKTDLVGKGLFILGIDNYQVLINSAVANIAKELRLDELEVDSALDPLAWSALGCNPAASLPAYHTSALTFERRRPDAPWLQVACRTLAVAGHISFATGIAQLKMTLFTRIG
jgi:hypothetical protein